MITGQVIMRDAGSADHLLPGENKRLMIVFGIISIHNDTPLKGEHQYDISGSMFEGDPLGVLHIEPKTEKDVSEHTIGDLPGNILTKQIWRV
jgi:hypothetical protein